MLKFVSVEPSDDFADIIFKFRNTLYKMSDFSGNKYRRGRLNFNTIITNFKKLSYKSQFIICLIMNLLI